MNEIRFTVPGKPTAWKRVKVGRYGQTYNPSQKDEETIGFYALAGRRNAKLSILGGSIRLQVICYGADPASDWDNLGKCVSDALNGVVWQDDRQVVDARVMKLPCAKGQERTEVQVEAIVA